MKRNGAKLWLLCGLLGATAATADKLSDFKEAAGKHGCESIPYDDLQRSCKSGQDGVDDYCGGNRGPVSCAFDTTPRELRDRLDRAKKVVDELKQKKRELEGSRPSDDKDKARVRNEIEDVGRALADAERAVEQAASDLDGRKQLVKDAMTNIDKCIDHRRAVMNVYSNAIDKVRGETDAAIKPYARDLRDSYSASKAGHERAITEKTNALEVCRRAGS